jgi:hypothetical protein
MRMLKWALVLAVPAVWVAAARPAETVVPQGTTVQLLLLRQKSVQAELKLSPDVVKKIMEFTNKQYVAFRNAVEGDKTELKQKVKELGTENQQFLKENLTPAQRKRVNQIALQETGLHQLSRPDVAKVLKLTKDQKKKFKALQKVTRVKLAKLLHGTSPENRKAEFTKLRKDTRKRIRALLTAAQKAKVKEIVGEPFKGEIVIEGPESVRPGQGGK